MSGEREQILDVLQVLEARLTSSNRAADAGRIGVIRRTIASEKHLDAALETLYGVKSFHQFSLRLMWYAEKGRDALAPSVTQHVISRRADELLFLLPSDHDAPEPQEAGLPVPAAAAVDAFGDAVEGVKREAHRDGRFVGVSEEMLTSLRSSARTLCTSAAFEENRDLAGFAEGMGRFLELVRFRGLSGDVRVVNLLDSANLTLQTALQTHAAEDYDSLQEITRLLESPLPLFEQPPPAPGQA
jgi:hypothetical protein